jgi:hypothetical protein
MKLTHIDEPELQFGTGKHIDIRFGLRNYGPLDFKDPSTPKQINVGIVGTPETIEGVSAWIDKCRKGIAAKTSKQPHLFSDFPGFTTEGNLQSSVYASTTLQSSISATIFRKLKEGKLAKAAVEKSVESFVEHIEGLAAKNANVIICAPPMELIHAMSVTEDSEQPSTESNKLVERGAVPDFHDLLKAKSMAFGKPIQILLPSTYDESKRRAQKRRTHLLQSHQDEATRAWNFHVALYYKAGGIPWRLPRPPGEYAACFVGVSFFQSLDKASLLTSVAQVFNERGEGMAVRGSAAYLDKDDLTIHIPMEGAFSLLNNALRAYELEHHHMPARVVLHKSSAFNAAERAGFEQAAESNRVHSLELLSLHDSGVRLFRIGLYPPLRGTLLELEDNRHALYTRGSVEFFATYPGLYVPQALGIRVEKAEQGPLFLAHEILALTKMNWNNTQFDGFEPITLKAARKVGRIFKYMNPTDKIQSRYSFYM